LGLAFGPDGSLFVGEYGNYRVIKLQEGSLMGSIVAGTGVVGSNATQLNTATAIVVDESSNIYVADDYNCRVMLWRHNSSSGVIVAGTGSCSNTTSTFFYSTGLAIDLQKTIYLSDQNNNRVMKWKQNATYGTLIAGTGVRGNSSQQLSCPYGLYLDELNSYLYIADACNHRIQRYYLGVTTNVTTVAGGNGQGSGNHQLNGSKGVCVSKKTGAIYIADTDNQRVQRWSPGATSGVTIAGIVGTSGTDPTLLNTPMAVALSPNETFLYVSDINNNRVQRFQLI
jgi:sugar lactone lactonase YvrE